MISNMVAVDKEGRRVRSLDAAAGAGSRRAFESIVYKAGSITAQSNLNPAGLKCLRSPLATPDQRHSDVIRCLRKRLQTEVEPQLPTSANGVIWAAPLAKLGAANSAPKAIDADDSRRSIKRPSRLGLVLCRWAQTRRRRAS